MHPHTTMRHVVNGGGGGRLQLGACPSCGTSADTPDFVVAQRDSFAVGGDSLSLPDRTYHIVFCKRTDSVPDEARGPHSSVSIGKRANAAACARDKRRRGRDDVLLIYSSR